MLTPRQLALLLLITIASACAATRAPTGSTGPATPNAAFTKVPWRSMHPVTFEAWLPSLSSTPITQAQLNALAQVAAQDELPIDALRATLILAHLDQRPAAALLIKQLESRHKHPQRPNDAADVTAAAYLGTCAFTSGLQIPKRLSALAKDQEPHPDLEVRTECARAALLLGRDDVADFLFKLTRLDTQLGRTRDGDWHSTITTTWARTRAAEALAERLAIPCPYRGDASLAHREQAALTLEAAWEDRPLRRQANARMFFDHELNL